MYHPPLGEEGRGDVVLSDRAAAVQPLRIPEAWSVAQRGEQPQLAAVRV